MGNISAEIKEKSKVTKEEWREYTKTVWHIANVSNAEHPAVFPEEIPMRLIKLFTFYGETVLDPFAGSGTTAYTALKYGRKAICVDQNERYISMMNEGLEKFNGTRHHAMIKKADSRNLKFVKDESVSLVVTSPPYWDKANYGDDSSNLGKIKNYKEFFKEMKPVIEECYRVLQAGRKICIVTANVNQHTDHGLLTFPLATDFTNLLREVGFVMVNEIIWSKDGTGGKWGSYGKQRPIFGSYPYPPNFLFKNVHEYILIFAKPSAKPVRGPKVISYETLMSTEGSDTVN
ncbi:MAG TPA: site-specific DNA-methyltransferase [Pyrinomonadaceae bacterium]|jgi:site-specific DNA-methyltransferase (adenine-specific)